MGQAGGPPSSSQEIEFAALFLLLTMWQERCGSAFIRRVDGKLYIEVGHTLLLDPFEAFTLLMDE